MSVRIQPGQTAFPLTCSPIPLYLSGGAMWQPMAVAIIFGLVFATFLTLGVVHPPQLRWHQKPSLRLREQTVCGDLRNG